MTNKILRYFSYYGCNDPERRRDNSPAADTKMDYIIEVLNRIGYDVEHVSLAQSATPKYISGYCEKKGNNTFRYFASFGKTLSPLRVFNRWFVHIQFLTWCLFNLKPNEQVLVYHSLGFDADFLFLKKVKGIRIIGDIEEIYQDVSKQKISKEKNEYRFIEICDKFLFPNTVLNERLNKNNRSYLVCHGIYKANEIVAEKFSDGKIHLLYSGTFDPVKGGAVASIRMAEFLPENYHLHITGFGDDTAVLSELRRIKNVAKCDITYHGYLDNEAFVNLMQSCSIGLCTQDPTSLLNLTSFPSKILNYMANGLVVLSGRNRAIEESSIADVIYYYDEQSPKAMADAVLRIEYSDLEEGRNLLNELDRHFKDGLEELIQL